MPRSLYTRRPNADGTTDSICNKCYVTVVTAIGESELDREEKRHVCDPAVLDYWRKMNDERRQVSGERNLFRCTWKDEAA